MSRRRFHAFRRGPAVLLILAFTACHAAREADPPVAPQLSARVLVCRVFPERTIRAIPRTLFGANLEWFNSADGLCGPNGQIDPEWIRLAREQGIDQFRFPGGTLSDFYHWRDGIGPVESRPVREHPTDAGRSANVFGTPEFIRFCRATGAAPLITVNAGTGDPAEAAAWVAYCNQPDNAARADDGLSEPAGVAWWEVGNELYLPGNPTDKKIITVSPTVYADRFLRFAAAMRQADPAIKLIAIGTANASRVALPYPDWSDILLQRAAGAMDAIAVHYYFPLIIGQSGLEVGRVYRNLLAAPEAVDRSLSALSARIAARERGRSIAIAVTEWGAFFSTDPAWVDHIKTMGTAVYLARMMQVFLGQPRVAVADYFKFTDRTMMGWVGFDQQPKIPYYVLQLYARHFGTQLVAAQIDSPTYSADGVGVIAPDPQVPEVTVAAARDESGRRLFVNLINRSGSTIHRVRLDLGPFRAGSTATGWVLSAPTPTDHNGRDLPDEVPAALYQEPPRSPGGHPIRLERTTVDLSIPVRLAPWSIVTLELGTPP